MKTIRIGLDKVDALYNYLVELIIAQMTFRQRGDDVIKLNHYAKQLKALKADIHADMSTQEPEDKNRVRILPGAITWKNSYKRNC